VSNIKTNQVRSGQYAKEGGLKKDILPTFLIVGKKQKGVVRAGETRSVARRGTEEGA